MIDHEKLPGGLNALFWESRKWKDGGDGDDTWHYMPAAGELRLIQPPQVRGSNRS